MAKTKAIKIREVKNAGENPSLRLKEPFKNERKKAIRGQKGGLPNISSIHCLPV